MIINVWRILNLILEKILDQLKLGTFLLILGLKEYYCTTTLGLGSLSKMG